MGKSISRRGFIGAAAAGTGTLMFAAAGVTGCMSNAGEKSALSKSSDSADASGWLGRAPEISAADIVETKQTDLLIIGAGNGGMAAAAAATDAGLDYMICEKHKGVQTCRDWIGAVNTKYHKAAGIEVDEGKILNELCRYASDKANPAVWNVWIHESAQMIDWVTGIMGTEPALDTIGYDHSTGGTSYYVPPIQHMYAFGPDSGIPDRNKQFEGYINGKGHEVTYGYDLQKLLRDGAAAVTGALFKTSDGYIQVNAKNTVLATGGYPANRDMALACSPIVNRCVTSEGYVDNKGEGIKAGMWVGAQRDPEGAPMIFDRGAVTPGTDAGYDDSGSLRSTYGGIGQFNLGSQPFMKVNREGKRFANESTPYDFICHAAADQPGGVWCSIFDANMPSDVTKFSTVGCSKITQMMLASGAPIDKLYADELDRGFLMKADTLDALADKLGFTGAAKKTFLAEVDRYNGLYDAQKDSDFGKEPFRLSAVRQAPFYGCWFGGTLLTTVDGLTIDENMRVMDTDRKPIEGLYAVGDCSGSLFSGNYPEYIVGCACGRTLTFGRHVVRYIAGLSK